MSDPHENLAEQALANLVNQFARPLDFLRELVQNSIDAGSPRIEVSIDFDPPKPGDTVGVTRIQVDDWGEGMDEGIIDNQLTRLFASAKEGDLTKIGKFGIGFTSIFAILPDAVLLRTGRHGENWELLFHRDRSFDKVRITDPVDGTKITLFKRMTREDLDKFIEEARFILTYWCEHSNVPITFWDRTEGARVEEVDEDDPFAAFESESAAADPRGPESVNHPLDVEADLSVRLRKDDVEVVAGVASQPLYGYYNGGLTLLRTRNTDALGQFEDRLRHLVFKVKNDALEHTLTRDNVLHDKHWEKAMGVVLEARLRLADALIDRLARAVEGGEDPTVWQAHLARLCEEIDVRDKVVDEAGDRPMFRSVLGEPVSLNAAEQGARRLGAMLVASDASPLNQAIHDAHSLKVLQDTPATRDLLTVTAPAPSWTFRSQRAIQRAEAVFVLPQVLESNELDDQERKLVQNTEELLRKAVGRRLGVRIGDFGGPETGTTEALVLNGNPADRVFQRPSPGGLWSWLPAFMNWRTMLINRYHPLFRAQLLASTEHPWLAAAGLASALLHTEDIEGAKVYRHLMSIAHARLGVTA
ncbi:MAG: ATP-binding protein [Myxococcota bacterium]